MHSYVIREFRMQAEELMDAIAKSKYSIGDVIKMVKGKSKPADEE